MEQGYEKRLLRSPYQSTNINPSRSLFGGSSKTQNDSQAGSSNRQSTDNRLGNERNQRANFVSEPVPEIQSNSLLSTLVMNELSESHSNISNSHVNFDCDNDENSFRVLSPRENSNLFSYKVCKESPCKLNTAAFSMSPVSEKSQRLLKYPQKVTRKIPRVPYKVLDAPELQDDFYLNLVDWSSQNFLAVGLGASVYLWNAFTSQVTRLCDLSSSNDTIASVAWSKKGKYLAIGNYRGCVRIWDVARATCVRSLYGHTARVGALAWNGDLLASGSRDRFIYLRDIRASAESGAGPSTPSTSLHSSSPSPSSDELDGFLAPQTTSPCPMDAEDVVDITPSLPPLTTSVDTEMQVDEQPQRQTTPLPGFPDQLTLRTNTTVNTTTTTTNDGNGNVGGTGSGATSLPGAVRVLKDHRQEVCGLKWSPDGQYLASGGNDNRLLVWSHHQTGNPILPVLTYSDHSAAVKAIAWSPHQHGLLASGGGTADRCLRFWNTLTGQALRRVDTGSQVCNITWSMHSDELVSTHGYSQNQILVWKYPSLQQLVRLSGHSYRVLYLAISPDGENIVTGAGDETLRFWNVFSKSTSGKARIAQARINFRMLNRSLCSRIGISPRTKLTVYSASVRPSLTCC